MVGRDAVDTAAAAFARAAADAEFAQHSARRRSAMADGTVPDVATSLLYNWTATRVQAWFRGRKCRLRYLYTRRCIIRCQRAWRDYADRVRRRVTPNEAAKTIQKAWRSHSSRRVYKYYRSMIAAVERWGDPRQLLKATFPQEAQMMDAAAGVHVRFRLGGGRFPPMIYFKIYTHRPVADVGTFAPRDYVREAVRKRQERSEWRGTKVALRATAGASGLLVGGVNTTGSSGRDWMGATMPERLPASTLRELTRDGTDRQRAPARYQMDSPEPRQARNTRVPPAWELEMSEWYRRVENNGWRPLSERLAGQAASGELGARQRRQAYWPVLRAERLADKEARQRRRRREWMMSLYRQGMRSALASGDDLGRDSDAAKATHETLAELEMPSDDDELESLVTWSKELDFDSYTDSWHASATSAGSEATLEMLRLDAIEVQALMLDAEERIEDAGGARTPTAARARRARAGRLTEVAKGRRAPHWRGRGQGCNGQLWL